jgi:hypothetical protein
MIRRSKKHFRHFIERGIVKVLILFAGLTAANANALDDSYPSTPQTQFSTAR